VNMRVNESRGYIAPAKVVRWGSKPVRCSRWQAGGYPSGFDCQVGVQYLSGQSTQQASIPNDQIWRLLGERHVNERFTFSGAKHVSFHGLFESPAQCNALMSMFQEFLYRLLVLECC
jgi:hypothetical protein